MDCPVLRCGAQILQVVSDGRNGASVTSGLVVYMFVCRNVASSGQAFAAGREAELTQDCAAACYDTQWYVMSVPL